jgi:hypothetical protein
MDCSRKMVPSLTRLADALDAPKFPWSEVAPGPAPLILIEVKLLQVRDYFVTYTLTLGRVPFRVAIRPSAGYRPPGRQTE